MSTYPVFNQSFRASRFFAGMALVMFLLGISGCTSLLPSSQNSMRSAWDDFSAVRGAYDRLRPQESTTTDLRREKFHPDVNATIVVLNQTDVMRRFILPNLPLEFLDPGVKDCLAALQKCTAYEVDIKQINRQRVGNFMLDVTAFKRETEVRGWRFNAVFLVKDDVLIYKTWGGQAQVAEEENIRNPLGLLQNLNPLSLTK